MKHSLVLKKIGMYFKEDCFLSDFRRQQCSFSFSPLFPISLKLNFKLNLEERCPEYFNTWFTLAYIRSSLKWQPDSCSCLRQKSWSSWFLPFSLPNYLFSYKSVCLVLPSLGPLCPLPPLLPAPHILYNSHIFPFLPYFVLSFPAIPWHVLYLFFHANHKLYQGREFVLFTALF